jgi:hypothetical protein
VSIDFSGAHRWSAAIRQATLVVPLVAFAPPRRGSFTLFDLATL